MADINKSRRDAKSLYNDFMQITFDPTASSAAVVNSQRNILGKRKHDDNDDNDESWREARLNVAPRTPPKAPPMKQLHPTEKAAPAPRPASLASSSCGPPKLEPTPPQYPPPWRRNALAPASVLPEGYGYWEDWDDPQAIKEESAIAAEFKMKMSDRGPPPPARGGPELWRDMAFDPNKNRWCWRLREELPQEYRDWVLARDWTSEAGLKLEAELAAKYCVPWALRGPPAPCNGGPALWRNMQWRPGTQKWMSRGGGKKQ